MNSENRKTVILLGAGSSAPAGFPSTTCLTERILSGIGIKRESDCVYYLKDPDDSEKAVVELVRDAVRHVYGKAELYFEKWKEPPPHYEHLYYVVKQLWDELAGEQENPAIDSFSEELKTELTPILSAASGLDVPDNLQGLYKEVCHYIADIVWLSLLRTPSDTSHLKPFAEACKTGRIVSFATLCHDTHVESYLRQVGVSLADGFSTSTRSRNGYRYWKNSWKKNCFSRKSIPFLKLHGSVDWFQFDGHSKQICIPPKDQYPQRLQSEEGAHVYAHNGRPEMLIGTFNKLAQYSQGIYLDLYYRFRRMLDTADQLAVCGYSFGDKGINAMITEWFDANPNGRRLLVVHPDHEELFNTARGAIRFRWKDPFFPDNPQPLYRATNVIPKQLQEVSVEEFLVRI